MYFTLVFSLKKDDERRILIAVVFFKRCDATNERRFMELMSKIALNATDIVITIPLLEEIPDTQTVDKVMEDIKERVQRIYMGIALNK